jgi:hypothetical protein
VAFNIAGFQDEAEADKLVKELMEIHDYQFKQLSPTFSRMARYWKLWMGERKDMRKEREQWRSLSWLGDPYQQTQTEVAVWLDSLNGIDPPYGAMGVGAEDEWKARAYERALTYFFRMNRWIYQQEMALTSASVQGWTVIEPQWREEVYFPIGPPPQEKMRAFDMAVNEGMKQGLPSPPNPQSQPDEFAQWHQGAKAMMPAFPSPPQFGPQETVAYRGPWFNRPSDFCLRFDPFREDWSEQEVVFRRAVKPWKWIENKVKEGVYDAEQVQKAKGAGATETNMLTTWEQEIAKVLDIPFNHNDPLYQNSGEVIEAWRPHDKSKPYAVLLNRTKIVNKRPDIYPWYHRQLPFVCVKNQPIKGMAHGMSTYQQLEQSFKDRVRFRDLLFDGLTLAVLPVFLKSRSLGMTDVAKMLEPGNILEVNDVNGFKPGWNSMPGFAELVQVGQMILEDQNIFNSTGSNVRGQSATVNRVSATESQSRLSQALLRHKQKALRLEDEFSPIIPQALSMVAQKWPSGDPKLMRLRGRIIGEDEQDPWLDKDLTKETFAEDLNRNVRFNGASRVQDRNLMAQQLKDFTRSRGPRSAPSCAGSTRRSGRRGSPKSCRPKETRRSSRRRNSPCRMRSPRASSRPRRSSNRWRRSRTRSRSRPPLARRRRSRTRTRRPTSSGSSNRWRDSSPRRSGGCRTPRR